ncbi:hypothetical protein [Streptomyces sp. CC210A]|uniref:hypothetical protein n=1 Tax=Streptomyces sp. CC210A TaxID=2898184 RepID=UPI001F2EEC19|nr:hypothetical protein [Streptomyces sp. CC210A]
MTILVRESAQNSWDARLTLENAHTPVDFRIDIWDIGPAHVSAWRDMLLAGAPASAENFPLRETMKSGPVHVLAVSDRGTRGLGGPTRADNAVGLGRDFVSFIRNIGEPRDTALSGGTYGFGKGIFYLLSKPGTVLVHSRCRTADDGFETRLIGCTLWRSYVAVAGEEKRRFTGRHWWGDTTGKVVEPLVGRAAEVAARRLGLKPFDAEETGTTVIVVDPHLDDLTPKEVAAYLADSIVWHLWPKMISRGDRPPAMRFSVSCDGVDHPVPDPRATRPLDMFVAAYEAMAGSEGHDVECRRPKRHLGRLGLVQRIRPPMAPSRASRLLDIETLVHHVCLLRPAELVVTYRPGPKPPSENQGYAGVFLADESLDEVYARAEPPTHDAWNPQSLEKHERTFVKTTFTRIDEALNNLLSLGGIARPGASNVALGAASTFFSGLVGGAWGIGAATAYTGHGDGGTGSAGQTTAQTSSTTGRAGATKSRAGGTLVPTSQNFEAAPTEQEDHHRDETGTRRRRPRVAYLGDPYYDERDGLTVLVQEFLLPVPGPQQVQVDLAVALTDIGGRETDPPIGASMPTLVGWEDAAGNLDASHTCLLEGGEGVWRALVRPAPDTVTEIAVRVEAVDVR